ncbi:cyclic nucleotide-binding domain-containing protein 2-like [Salvelinus fontinalis]|uniref:cyclic nucleotide-binding domain-containing protein 2-like n=1 Tax=Salvelinus fontinalis TaxID=8038 RepID=UPI00248671DE|nr:cyclic nucleotide-binding domain-containing protein 2-like [Salvelinus fontinalis]
MLFSAPVQAAPCRGKLGFKWAVRSVILMTRFCRYFMSRSNYRQFMEFNFCETITNQPAGGTGTNLVFDLNHFKVKEDRIPVLLVEIMRKCPEERSESEVLLVHNMLSSVSMFRRYSGTLQLLLARVVRYQRLERRRVVIKKGHWGHSFYFVFSGLLAVTKDNDGSSAFVDKEPILIKKGMNFGDVALIKTLRRNATVVCMEETELMVVDKEDFFANKMDVELKKEFDYRFRFFRSLQLVSSWSYSLIEQMADHSKAEQFRYGHVVVKDTNDMGNIIFIGKGQCDVLRVVDLTSCSAYQRLLKQYADSVSRGTCLPTNGFKGELTIQPGSVIKHKVLLNNPPRPPRGLPADLPTRACFLIDTLHQSSTFGLNQYLMPSKQRDCRRFTLVSQSVEILRVEKTRFDKLVDNTTMKKLEALQKTYPSDDELCTVFLEHSRWKDYKHSVVQDLFPHRVAPIRNPKTQKQQGHCGPSQALQQTRHVVNRLKQTKQRVEPKKY